MHSFAPPAQTPRKEARAAMQPESPNSVLLGIDAINTPGSVLLGPGDDGVLRAVTAERREEQMQSLAERAYDDLEVARAEHDAAMAEVGAGPQPMPRYCTHCGSRNPTNPARFCASCGSALGNTVAFAAPRVPDTRTPAEKSAAAAAAAGVQQVPISGCPPTRRCTTCR
jgi:hypothetical protein